MRTAAPWQWSPCMGGGASCASSTVEIHVALEKSTENKQIDDATVTEEMTSKQKVTWVMESRVDTLVSINAISEFSRQMC